MKRHADNESIFLQRPLNLRDRLVEQGKITVCDGSINLIGLGSLLCLCLVLGCSAIDFNKPIPWLDPDTEVKQPTRVTALWTHTVLNEPGKKGVRGFGGRILFHADANHEKAVKVSGTLTVYAFDVTTRASVTPDRKYVFTPEQFEEHYSHSKLGHSYSIWLPWDEVGGGPRRINLMARFEPSEGSGMIMSEDAMQILPGITKEPAEENKTDSQDENASSGIQQAGYQVPAKSSAGGRAINRVTLTDADPIDLPPSFSRRIAPDDTEIDESPLKLPGKPPRRLTHENSSGGTDELKRGDADVRTSQTDSPFNQLKERQRSLSDHFGQRKSQVRTASSVRPKPAPLPNSLPQSGEQSLLPQSSSRVEKDPFETEDSPAAANSR